MAGSRTQKARRNVIFGYADKFLVTVLEFIKRTFFIRILGESLLGINGVFTNVIQILSLAELGLNNIVGYSFYKPLAQKDDVKIASLIAFYHRTYNVIALVVLAVGLMLFPCVPYIIKLDVEIQHINFIYLIFLADTVLSYLFVYKTILLNADQKDYLNKIYTMAGNVVRSALQIASLVLFKNIFIYLALNVAVHFFVNFSLSRRTEKEYPFIRGISNPLEKSDRTELVQLIKSGFVYRLAGILLNSTDNILVSVLIGTVWVGYIANYDMLYAGLGAFYTILFAALTPAIGELIEKENEQKLREIFNLMNYVSAWMAVAVATCYFCLSRDFVTLWLGEEFVLDERTVFFKSFIVFLSCSMQPVFSFREATGLYKKTKYVMLAAALLNIALSVLLGKIMGLSGIIAASVISMLSTYCWYEPFLLYKDYFSAPSGRFFLKRVLDTLLFILVSFLFSFALKNWRCGNFFWWLVKALVTFCAVNAVCLASYCRFPERKLVTARLRRKGR